MKALKVFSQLIVLFLIICIIPSGVSALESGTQVNSTYQTSGQLFDIKFVYRGNINEENFSTFKADILNTLNKQIIELQALYTAVNRTSNSSELEKVMANHSLAKDKTWQGSMQTGSGTIYIKSGSGPGKTHVFSYNLENITEANFKETRSKMLGSLENMTQGLEAEKKDFKAAGANEMAQELDSQITELQNLHTNVSKASNASELKNALTTHMQTEAFTHIEEEIKSFENEMNKYNSQENTDSAINYSQFNNEIKDINNFMNDDEISSEMEAF
ncbi:MAG: hypothetical protein ACPK85_08790 [Methanosarcina sp.]